MNYRKGEFIARWVRRLSVPVKKRRLRAALRGQGALRAIVRSAAALAGDFLKSGKSEPLGDGAMAYPAINALFGRR